MNRQPNHYSVNSRPQNEPMKSDTTGSVECLCSPRHSLPRSTVGGAATHIQLKRSGLKWAGHQSDWVIQIKLVKRRMLQRKEWFARNLIQSRPSECILTRWRGFVTSCCFIVEKNSHYNIIIPPPPRVPHRWWPSLASPPLAVSTRATRRRQRRSWGSTRTEAPCRQGSPSSRSPPTRRSCRRRRRCSSTGSGRRSRSCSSDR